jgi:diguanylate cyclase (GGDEF)-like protein/PAS domain S-box-containing protein
MPRTLACAFFGLLIAALGARPASAAGPDRGGRSSLDRVTLQLKWKHQFQFAGYYAGVEKGFYRAAGLDVRLREAPENLGPDEMPGEKVLQGEAEFGIASSDLVLLRTRGKPVVALAAIYQHSPLVLLALKRSGIDSIHDLAGRKVAIEAHADELRAYLKHESVPASRMTLVPHTYDTGALQSGTVDAMSAYSTDEPFQLRQAGLEYLTFNPRSGGIDFYGDTLFTTEREVREHPARVRAFVDASLKGWRYALAHPEEMVSLILSRYSKRHTREHLRFEAEQTRKLILPDVVEVGYMNPGRWQHILDTYVELGMAPPGASLSGFVYDRNPRPDLRWLYGSLAGALLVLLGVSLVAARFYRLSADLRREMKVRARAEADLGALEQRYRVLVENAPFPIVITRAADGTVRYLNPKAAEVLRIRQDCALGRPAEEFYCDPAERTQVVEALARQGFVEGREVRLRTADGHPFWAALSATSIEFEHERAAFIAVMDLTERKALETRLEEMAMTDPLTGLHNRRSFVALGEQAIARARADGTSLSLLVLDIDRFKVINDTHGHQAGDDALRHLADSLRRHLRKGDLPGRLGGDEFGILLPETSLEEAAQLAERLRARIEHEEIRIGGERVRLTVSIGTASLEPGMAGLDDLMRPADAALYDAKGRGRNRVGGHETRPSATA